MVVTFIKKCTIKKKVAKWETSILYNYSHQPKQLYNMTRDNLNHKVGKVKAQKMNWFQYKHINQKLKTSMSDYFLQTVHIHIKCEVLKISFQYIGTFVSLSNFHIRGIAMAKLDTACPK